MQINYPHTPRDSGLVHRGDLISIIGPNRQVISQAIVIVKAM